MSNTLADETKLAQIISAEILEEFHKKNLTDVQRLEDLSEEEWNKWVDLHAPGSPGKYGVTGRAILLASYRTFLHEYKEVQLQKLDVK